MSSQKKPPATRKRAAPQSGPIDRYNYVDRDIYSGRRPPNKSGKRKKRASPFKRFVLTFFVLLLVVALAGGTYFFVMTGRLNHSGGPANTASYVELPSAAPNVSVMKDDKVINILLLGEDKGDDGKSHRSDSCILLSIDNEYKALRLTSFLRDMYIQVPGVGMNKFNAAYAYGGAPLAMQTLENNFRVRIDKYVTIDFDSFSKLIDKMGGISIDMSAASAKYENSIIGSHLKEGVNLLNGAEALYYARMRYLDSDYARTGRQRQMLEAIIDKFKSLNPIQMSQTLYDYLPSVNLNLTEGDLAYLLTLAPSALSYKQITMQVPAMNTFTEPTIKGIGSVQDFDLPKNSELLRDFLYNNGSGKQAPAGTDGSKKK